MKQLIILGSTGSIGTSSLDVIAANPDQFCAVGLTANASADVMCEQVRTHRPEAVAMADSAAADIVRREVGSLVRVYEGDSGILEMIRSLEAEAVVNGLVGSAGMLPTVTALEDNKDVYLANKETIVMAGEIVMETVSSTGRRIVPIDSEMSAIYQCLKGEKHAHVRRLILTASGGPFVDWSAERLKTATVKEALNHPNWDMGTKNTVDSATLMNKGLEVIEAARLFDVPPEKVDVTVHRSSIAHSFVEYIDGSILCQLSVPDMRLAIQYAMSDPERLQSPYGGLDFNEVFSLTFEPPDMERFPCLGLAFEALRRGGTASAAMNGANEQAVEAFVSGDIAFMDIPALILRVMDEHDFIKHPTIGELVETDVDAKRRITEMIKSM